MVKIQEETLQEILYLFDQAVRGHHLLFSTEDIKSLKPKSSLSSLSETSSQMMEKVLSTPSLRAKRKILETLEPSLYQEVLQVYLNLIENYSHDQLEGIPHS